eukprot:4918426-Amphidinium_carterae.2
MVTSMCHPADLLVHASFLGHLEELKLSADTLSLTLDGRSRSALWLPHTATDVFATCSILHATQRLQGKYDLMEIFGGKAGCSSIAVRLDLLKPVYGLKDAPRAWELRLKQLLSEGGLKPSMTDPRLYMLCAHDISEADRAKLKHQLELGPPSQLVLACTTHVDDIKITGLPALTTSLSKHLETHVGKLTIESTQFIHTGVAHEVHANGLYVHQSHYVQQIQPAVLTHLKSQAAESPLTEIDRLVFLSLLGAWSWLVQTRPDLAIHVHALQRRGHAPRKLDLVRANSALRYAKTTQVGLWYPRLKGPVRLVMFSDAAFRTQPEDSSGLAIKGSALVLVPTSVDPRQGFHTPCHLLDFMSTRQRRVVRSTFSAELNGLLDATERGYGIQMTLSELLMKKEDARARTAAPQARTLQALWESGSLFPHLWACVDAKSVFDALEAPDFHIPSDDSLCLHLLALRNDMAVRKLRVLLWIDTRSMLADALTKGKVDKKQIVLAANAGTLQIPADHVRLSARYEHQIG